MVWVMFPPLLTPKPLCLGYWELLWLWRDAEFVCVHSLEVQIEAPELWVSVPQNCYPAPVNVCQLSSERN